MPACHKRVVPTKIATDSTSMQEEVSQVDVREIDFQYFKAKAKINYIDAAANQVANVDVRMKKDSIIWLSISKLGIEGVRCQITRDSAYIIDRLNGGYEVYDFKALGKRFNFNLSFEIIQAAILGNLPVSKLYKDKLKVTRDKDYYRVRQKQDSIIVDNYISAGDMKLKKALFVEPKTNNSLTLTYENFELINDVLFPFNSNISLRYKSPQGTYNTIVTIQYTKAEVGDKELKFPFNPPAKRKDEKK